MAQPLLPGVIFAGHRIEGVAGRGGMGVVYRATHLALDHVVALKVISPALAQDERFRRRFGEESRIAVSIRHPNVVAIHDAGEEDGLLFVTMDLIAGTDLRILLNREGRLEPGRAGAIVTEVASALDAAHSRGLVHRDIKPGNVLIEGEGAQERVYLTDFGLARLVEASTGVTATGAFVGTLDYCAPEQIRGERVDARSDVYALGCVLFEMVTGNPPFAARDDKVAKMYAHLSEEPPRLRVLHPELPGDLDLVVSRALAKEPDERFPSAGDLARATAAAVVGQATVEVERSVGRGAAAPEDAPAEAEAPPAAEPAPAPQPSLTPAPEPSRATDDMARPPTPAPTDRRRRGGNRRLAWILGIASVLIIAAVVGLLATGSDEQGPGNEAVTELGGASDGPATGSGNGDQGGEATAKADVVATVTGIGGVPVELSHGEGGVWVTSREGGQATFIDAEADSQRIADTIALGSLPEGIAVAGDTGSIWVALGGEGRVVKFKAGEDAISDQATGFAKPQGVAFADDSIWVTDAVAGTLTELNPITGAILSEATVGREPYGIAVGEGAVWVTNRADSTVSRVPLDGGDPTEFPVGANPKGIAVAAGSIWVAATDVAELQQFRPDGMEVKSIDTGPMPRGVVAAFGSVWVAVGGADEVVRVDAESGEKLQTITVEGGPEGITAGPETIWVASGIAGSVSRIDPSAATKSPNDS